MEVKGRVFLVLSLFLVSATVSQALSKRDPEIGDCKVLCEGIRGVEEDEKLGCKQRCEKYSQEKQKREREGGQEKERSHGGAGAGGRNIIFADLERDLREMVGKCQQTCQGRKGEQEKPECFRECMEQYQPEEGKRRGGGGGSSRKTDREFGKGQESNNPFVFEDHHFTTRLESQQGSIRVLQKFTDRSDIFQGIEKYRVAFLEVQPQTFMLPGHWDADGLFFVANGEGTISMINMDSRQPHNIKRQTHNIKRGDIFRVPAGISAYLINRHANERLVIVKILHSISVPGELQTFSVRGDNPESSFLNAFSTEILEAAFDTDRDSVERLFRQRRQEQGQRQEGMIKEATEEQIRSLSGKDEGGIWPFGDRKGPYNIYKNKPSVENEYGNLLEVCADDLPDLRDINVAFSLFNITQGSMAGPFYHTKATLVLVVADGSGGFEMACPHLAEQTGGSGGVGDVPSYEKVSSQLRRGTVVVIPAGHPIVIEASGEQNLEVIGFGLNTGHNEWFPLAGRDNVMSQWEDEAIGLTFGAPVNEVKKVIQNQNKKLFFQGPVRRGRAFA